VEIREADGRPIRPISFKDFDAEVARCNALYNEAWCANWGFVKMSHAEFRYLAQHLKQFAVPEWILIAEVDGRPAGLCVTIPDFNEATRPLNGRLTQYGLPIGLLRLNRNLRRIHAARLLVLGVIPEFRSRGVAELLMLRTIEIGRQQMGCARGEVGWTLEDNDSINGPIAKVGGQRYKTYRIYQARLRKGT
jgi:GNAT superfamily N-acetyltransferase